MKISVITLHAVVNYGSALQSYATQKIFEDMGLEVEIIDYRREAILPKSVKQILTGQGSAASKIKSLLIKPSSDRGRKVFQDFLTQRLTLTPHCYTHDEDFRRYPLTADVFCTGSDQVWNSDWHDGIPHPFCLSFVEQGKKIAFAASFGKAQLEEAEKDEFRSLLRDYDAISVREAQGVEILHDLGFSDAVQVLDPTLSVPTETWLELSEKPAVKGKYILIYQLCPNKEFDRYAVRLAKQKGLKLIRLCTRYDQLRMPGHGIVLPKVEDFVSLVRHADYVLTDSFHCTAFCLMLHKQFASFYPNRFGSRLESILALTGQSDRLLTDYSDLSVVDRLIDYEKVDTVFASERKRTVDFLKNAFGLRGEL